MFRLVAVILMFWVANAQAVVHGVVVDSASNKETFYIHLEGSRECSAVLIAPQLLLTAAHCLEGYDPSVSMGAAKQKMKLANGADSSDYQRIRPQAVLMLSSEDFGAGIDSKQAGADLGIIKVRENLLEKFNLNQDVLPRLIESQNELLEATDSNNSELIGVGYGIYELGKWSDKTGEKRLLNFKIAEIGQNTIQTASTENGVGVCVGDSGGGLFVNTNGRKTLVGILSGISKGVPCGSVNSRAFYVNILTHLCWVQNKSQTDLGILNCKNN